MAEPESIFITADEVDEPPPPPEAFGAVKDPTISGSEELESHTLGLKPLSRNGEIQSPPRQLRPPLRRDKSAPQAGGTWIDLQRSNLDPAHEANGNDTQPAGLWNTPDNAANPTDSLSLGQLKKLVQDMPRVEPTPYAFEYQDTSSFEEDLEELFSYTWEERRNLLKGRDTFEQIWKAFNASARAISPAYKDGDLNWCTTDSALRSRFLEHLGHKISYGDEGDKIESLECLLYLALGCWYETAGLCDPSHEPGTTPLDTPSQAVSEATYEYSALQVRYIKENIQIITETISISVIFDILRTAYEPSPPSDDDEQHDIEAQPDIYQQRERSITQILLYLFVDLARRESQTLLGSQLRMALEPFAPQLLIVLTDILVKTRWDDAESVPPSKLLILYWKTILLVFGGITDVGGIKDAFAGSDVEAQNKAAEPRITASPLDYHVFRQEIISKYPAYNPPPAMFPFEPENNSFLPPLQDFVNKNSGSNPQSSSATEGPANIPGAGTSILNQPVHIATPAPSPPPSPAGPGGKGLKKQNYQTNQMFPFLYPPLDASSNDLGGKGSTELQDLFAGRKWHGSDIPASILEAADLFARRMRATRAMKQLWEERVRFMKFEQGYGSLDSVNGRDRLANGWIGKLSPDDMDDLQVLNNDQRVRLNAVEAFYKDMLPRLQSMIIVLLKPLVQTITTLITQVDGLDALQTNGTGSDPKIPPSSGASNEATATTRLEDDGDPSFHDLTIMRNQEIMSKAVSGILILLLKWFKVSHILKFEYLSQILLDSNYIQLVLKLFTHQELERAVNYRCERRDLNFFNFCHANSRNTNTASPTNQDSEDDAEPPPISLKRHGRKSPTVSSPSTSDSRISGSPPKPAPTQPPPNPPAPEVDELGYPTSALPADPITNYSWRTFYTSINHLRILQKIIKSKPHRQLLMVQGKYSNTLKKHLKVPQPDVRLYTLKIIKGQVPYCHRKWRQSNMRIITAIYLHVKPGLRDEWLSGLDVEQEVGEALPAEQALRALTYWYNLRRYPGEMGVAESASVSASASALPPGIAGKFSEDFTLDTEPDLVTREAMESDMSNLEELLIARLDPEAAAEATAASETISVVDSSNVTALEPIDTAQSSIPSVDMIRAGSSDNKLESTEPSSSNPADATTQQEHVPPLMLREQDFFLRELEKMDLGLSLPSPSASRSSSRHSSRPVSSAGNATLEQEPDLQLAPAQSLDQGQDEAPHHILAQDPTHTLIQTPPSALDSHDMVEIAVTEVSPPTEAADGESMILAMQADPDTSEPVQDQVPPHVQAQAQAKAEALQVADVPEPLPPS